MASTVKSFLTKASIQLMDNNPQFKRWKQSEMLGWTNDGQLAIGKYMPWTIARIDAIKLKTGTRQSIDTIAAADVVTGDGSTARTMRGLLLQSIDMNMGSDGLTPGRAIRIVDKDTLDAGNPNWHLPRNADIEVSEYAYDPRLPKTFWVYPGVAVDNDVYVLANMLIEPIALDTAVDHTSGAGASILLSIDATDEDELLNYVLARAYLKDAESESDANLIAIHSKLFTDSINARVKARTGVNPNLKSLPLNPAMPATSS